MAKKGAVHLDEKDHLILDLLQRQGRISFAALGRRVGLSPPAVAERVRRLEDLGVIRGYGARVDLEALGYGVNALIELATDPVRYDAVWQYAEKEPRVRECYFVTGASSFILRVVAPSIDGLRAVIEDLSALGETRTSVVLKRPLIKETFLLEDAADL